MLFHSFYSRITSAMVAVILLHNDVKLPLLEIRQTGVETTPNFWFRNVALNVYTDVKFS